MTEMCYVPECGVDPRWSAVVIQGVDDGQEFCDDHLLMGLDVMVDTYCDVAAVGEMTCLECGRAIALSGTSWELLIPGNGVNRISPEVSRAAVAMGHRHRPFVEIKVMPL